MRLLFDSILGPCLRRGYAVRLRVALDHPRSDPSHPQLVCHDDPSNLNDDPQLQAANAEEKEPQGYARKNAEDEG